MRQAAELRVADDMGATGLPSAPVARRAVPSRAGQPGSGVPPLHVLITVNASWNLVNFRKGLIEALLADGHRVTALAPRDATSDELVAMGCRFLPLEMDSTRLSPVRDLALLRQLWGVFRRERPDAIVSYTIKNNVYGALAARALGIPFLPNVSGLGTAFSSRSPLQLLVKPLYRAAFGRVPVVFFQNDEDRALFVDERIVAPDRTHILPGSGVDLQRFVPAPPPGNANVRFLLVARMLEEKGVADFVEAARIVRREHPDAEFQLLGSLSLDNRSAISAATMASWCDEGVVTYLGEVRDVYPHIAAADCMVLPTYYREGTPRSLLEAAAMARPIITTDTAGCRDVVEPGRTGFLCRPRDPEHLAARMLEMMALGPEGRAEMGRNGRSRMERRYDEKFVISAYREHIQRHCGSMQAPKSQKQPGTGLH